MLVCRAWGLLLLPVLLLWTSGSYTLCICVELSVKASINNMGLYVDRPPHSCWLTMCFLDKGVIVYVELLSFTVKRQHFESHETLQLIWMHHTDSWMWNEMVLFVRVASIVADVSDVVQPRASAGVGPSVSLGLDASVSRRLFCLIAVYTHTLDTETETGSFTQQTLWKDSRWTLTLLNVDQNVWINTPAALLFLYSSWFQLRIDLILL